MVETQHIRAMDECASETPECGGYPRYHSHYHFFHHCVVSACKVPSFLAAPFLLGAVHSPTRCRSTESLEAIQQIERNNAHIGFERRI